MSRLTRILDARFERGRQDGAKGESRRDPSYVQGCEPYARWAYDAGHRQGLAEFEQLRLRIGASGVVPMTEGRVEIAPLPRRCTGTLGDKPSWMSWGQYDPCRCRLDAGHDGPHWCEHLDSADPRQGAGQEGPVV